MHDTNTSARASGSRAIENETGPRTSAAADASCCPGGPSGQPLCPCGGCPRRAGGKRGRGAAGSRLCEMERQGPPHGAMTGAAPWEPGSPYGTRRAFCCGRCQVCSQLRKFITMLGRGLVVFTASYFCLCFNLRLVGPTLFQSSFITASRKTPMTDVIYFVVIYPISTLLSPRSREVQVSAPQ